MSLADDVLKGDVRAAARLISLIEDEAPEAAVEMQRLYPHTGKAYIIGVTGAPGVGKSTLTDSLIGALRRQDKTVGVIAIDPTSALTGGAILGDRIRMQRHGADPGVFIRSLATRGWTGGLAKAALGAAHVMDAMGKDFIIIETVGSGQVEIDIVKAADTALLVLSPGAGDEIQTMKAGIIETVDIIAVNKADNPGADRLKSDVAAMLSLKARKADDWLPPVVATVAVSDKGTGELLAGILQHGDFLQRSGGLVQRRRERIRLELVETVEAAFKNALGELDSGAIDTLVEKLSEGKTGFPKAAGEILKRIAGKINETGTNYGF
jgi:LAO/AO transport system kinase